MALTTCELIWINQLIHELKIIEISYMKLFYDIQMALHIESNPVFQKKTKYIKIACHFVHEKML